MDHIKIILLYILAGFVLPYSWLREQPLAIRLAWLDSFGAAHDRVKGILRKRRERSQSTSDL
ncbi:hypothetical protein SAMN05444339_10261 [Loktanella atrilutea]|uniref:Uncharacterized protein n=1 Tax=Loktanella atrilutea TaxID=366533 RepID=A0A1M4WCD1_LOKAT|nr:hypothetical protein [Loktanella atrilutea]SHE78723.1 hypothetical protein SAMN05444339_10261 [Loktanella atrilutea]